MPYLANVLYDFSLFFQLFFGHSSEIHLHSWKIFTFFAPVNYRFHDPYSNFSCSIVKIINMLPDEDEVQDTSLQHWTGHRLLQSRLFLSAQSPFPQKVLPLLTFARVLKICPIQKPTCPFTPESIMKIVQEPKKLVPLLPVLTIENKSLSAELYGQMAKKQTLVDTYFSAPSV